MLAAVRLQLQRNSSSTALLDTSPDIPGEMIKSEMKLHKSDKIKCMSTRTILKAKWGLVKLLAKISVGRLHEDMGETSDLFLERSDDQKGVEDDAVSDDLVNGSRPVAYCKGCYDPNETKAQVDDGDDNPGLQKAGSSVPGSVDEQRTDHGVEDTKNDQDADRYECVHAESPCQGSFVVIELLLSFLHFLAHFVPQGSRDHERPTSEEGSTDEEQDSGGD